MRLPVTIMADFLGEEEVVEVVEAAEVRVIEEDHELPKAGAGVRTLILRTRTTICLGVVVEAPLDLATAGPQAQEAVGMILVPGGPQTREAVGTIG